MVTTRSRCTCDSCKVIDHIRGKLAIETCMRVAAVGRAKQMEGLVNRLRHRLEQKEEELREVREQQEEQLEEMRKKLAEKIDLIEIFQRQKTEEQKKKEDEMRPSVNLSHILKSDRSSWQPVVVAVQNPSFHDVTVFCPNNGTETNVGKSGDVSLSKSVLERAYLSKSQITLEFAHSLRDHSIRARGAEKIIKPIMVVNLDIVDPHRFIQVNRDGETFVVTIDNSELMINGLFFELAAGARMDYGGPEKEKQYNIYHKKINIRVTPYRCSKKRLLLKVKSHLQADFHHSVLAGDAPNYYGDAETTDFI